MCQKRTFYFLVGETIPVNKPYRWTSFDVVNKVRYDVKNHLRIPKLKIGHAGTLDPLATGLLILCTGKHTKQIESLQDLEKEYSGTIRLGATTPSFDLETEIDRQFTYEHIGLEDIEQAAKELTGEILQTPPVFSAIKVDGRRAFDYARKEEELLLKSRKVMVHSFSITSWNPPDCGFRIVCSKGTYIRSIARDIGLLLNSGAHLTSLHRDRIGHFHSKEAFELDELLNRIKSMGGDDEKNILG
jgi:tRNA pseudouridine55 synthase